MVIAANNYVFCLKVVLHSNSKLMNLFTLFAFTQIFVNFCFFVFLTIYLVNGFKKVEFHIQGDLLAYSKEQIESILETVAVILQCGKKEIIVNGLRQANSFFIVLSIKEMYMKKLLNLNESGRDELQKQNIDYFIIDKTLVSLKRKKGKYYLLVFFTFSHNT